jgi:hypothetical protein
MRAFAFALSLLLLFSVGATQLQAQTTITSSPSGGNWNSPSTWIGSIVPSSLDHVVINSDVYVDAEVSCNNLTVNASSSLHNTYAYSPTVTVNGSILNNGTIAYNPSGYSFYLSLKGDVENNGSWNLSSTTLSGTTNQQIKEASGKKFEGPFVVSDSIGDIVLGSDVLFANNTLSLNRAAIKTNGFKLFTTGYALRNGYIQSNDYLKLDESIIESMTINGNFTLDGNVHSEDKNKFIGTATIQDTLFNRYAYSNTLTIKGKVINNGAIIGNPAGYAFYLNVDGDIENNGIWRLTGTSITGSADHYIQASAGKNFEGPFSMTDSIGDLLLKSNVSFLSNTFSLNKTKLRTNGFELNTKDYALRNGSIISNETMTLDNSIIESMKFYGNYSIGGNVLSEGNNEMYDNCTITDTLFNRYGWTNTLAVKGNITNKGTIKYNPQGYSFYLDVTGNIDNQGIWYPNATNLVSASNQTVKQNVGKKFEGTFNTTDSIGDVVLGSNINMENNTWNLNKSKILTNGFKLCTNNVTLSDGKIQSADTLIIDNSVIRYMKFYGDYKLGGNVYSEEGNVFNGEATVIDTLFNKYGWTNTLTVKGNITNKGTIKYNPQGYSFYLDVTGNINNEGIWNPHVTNLVSTSNQTMQQKAGKKFEGTFNTTDSIGDIALASNVMMESNTWNLNKAKVLTNGFKLNTNNYTLSDGKIQSNDTITLDNSIIRYMKFYGNYKLGGNIYSETGNELNDNATVIDTLFNRYGWTNTLVVKGNITNKGTIKYNPQGYSFNLDVTGNIDNQGIWYPNATNLVSTSNQTIQQKAGKRFEGAFVTTDSIGDVLLGTNVSMESNSWNLNKARLLTNGHKLSANNYTLTNGKVVSSDTLNLNNSIIESLKLYGNLKLDGNVYSQSNNEFYDTLTVLDTLTNRYGWTNTLVGHGSIINKGAIVNNPSGYSFHLLLKGGIENHHIISISNLTLAGTKPRNIGGSNALGIQANIIVDDSVHLAGTNTLPSMTFSANPKAYCIIDTASTLTLMSASTSARILNYGRVSVIQTVDNTIPNTLSFFDASMSCKAGVTMNKLNIDQFGNQQHPTASGTVNSWWRVRNYPQNFTDSLSYLKLNYRAEGINGNIEDSLKVYYSSNAGLKWTRIKTGVTLDKVTKTVTINNAPSSGHYILAASPTGILTFHPSIEGAEPRMGGNSGQVTMYIYGAGFKSTSRAVLMKNGVEISSDTTYVTDAIGESMLATFNLKGKSVGTYDVKITTPADTTLILPAYFKVEQGERSAPWVALTGRDRFLLNRTQTFNLNYGNTANVDAKGTLLTFVVNDIPGLEVTFPDMKLSLPLAVIAMGKDYTRIQDSVKTYFVTDTLSGYQGIKMRVYPFYIPMLPAGSSKNSRVLVKLNGAGSLTMNAWVTDPFFETIDRSKVKAASSEPMPTEVRACITAAAMKYYATSALSLIPGMGCYTLVDKIVDPIGKITPESIKPEDSPTQSWLWSCVSWAGSITQCATSFMPGLGQATQMGIGIVNMMIDSKDNLSTEEGCWRKFKKKSESKRDSRGVTSFDPNEMVGPQGYGKDHYISKDGNLNYRIYFENKKTAGASALEVFVKDTIDTQKFDLSTFSFKSITFADTTVNIQDYAKEFTILVDRFPKKDIIVQVHGVLDSIKGIISWDFHSLDRVTMELTEDPDLGFLSPNVTSPEGEGNVAFSCKLKSTVAHDDVIVNKATIVFDFNAPIVTNTFSNKIDAAVPTSSVTNLDLTQQSTTFPVAFTGSDNGAGLAGCKIFVSVNDSAYYLWKTANSTAPINFSGKNGKTYKFYSLATDSIGLAEPQKLQAEAVTTVLVTDKADVTISPKVSFYPNPASDFIMINADVRTSRDAIVRLIDVYGKIVLVQPLVAGTQKISLVNLPDGTYIMECISDEGVSRQKLLVKK